MSDRFLIEMEISTVPYTFICPEKPEDSFVFHVPTEEEDDMTFEELESRLEEHLTKKRSDIQKIQVTEVYTGLIDKKQTVSYYKDIQPFYVDITYRNVVGQNECNSVISFVNVDNQNKNAITSRKFSPDAPKWRHVTDGTNLEGLCTNSQCVADKKMVICGVGYKCFDLIQEMEKCKCPLCGEFVEPITCGFTNCVYWFAGKYREDKSKPPKKMIPQDIKKIASNDRYERFNPQEKPVFWVSLKIYSQAQDDKSNDVNVCGICKVSVPDDNKVKREGCTRFYHSKCIKKLENIQKLCVLCYA